MHSGNLYPELSLEPHLIDTRELEELAARLSAVMPPGLGAVRRELEENFHAVLQSQLPRLNLVGREEFEAAQQMLAATRARIEELERQVQTLEQQREA